MVKARIKGLGSRLGIRSVFKTRVKGQVSASIKSLGLRVKGYVSAALKLAHAVKLQKQN